ncbi:MAG: hypothetical protein HYW06_10115 [Gemmatimonadetes bacterium]|nr:hypothetical protein [Gemmatimonadota bacterium]MBI2403737.1 hypothetical protein [Gemmatimonadota bacterium]MBI2537293.1 hypothetical protein [Gemmatimonadota bacterium]
MGVTTRVNAELPDAHLHNTDETRRVVVELIRVQNAHYGSLIRAAYGEPFMTQETVRVDDVVTMGVRSI